MLASRMEVARLYLSREVLTMSPSMIGMENVSRPRTAAFLRLCLKSSMLMSKPAKSMM